jgi:hypothetical protein
MNIKRIGTLLAIVSIVFVVGCRTSPIFNVQNAAIPSSSDAKLKTDDVKKAIIRAGNSLGWTMEAAKPGAIVGTLRVRDHVAVVDIPYDENSYSILYKDSQNLKHTGTSIHSNYNSWVQNLDKAIKLQLNMTQQ